MGSFALVLGIFGIALFLLCIEIYVFISGIDYIYRINGSNKSKSVKITAHIFGLIISPFAYIAWALSCFFNHYTLK